MSAAPEDCDSPVRLLLPWMHTGRLSAEDAERVAAHLETCAACRADLALDREIAARFGAPEAIVRAPGGALKSFLTRLATGGDEAAGSDAEEIRPTRGGGDALAPRRRPLRRLLLALVAMQALVIVGLAALIVAERGTAQYATLSAPTTLPAAPAIRVAFAPETPFGEVATLLERAGLTMIDGPSPSGVCTVAIRSDVAPLAALQALRGDRRVTFAEPVEPRAARGAP